MRGCHARPSVPSAAPGVGTWCSASAGPIDLQLADGFRTALARGDLLSGTRLPAERDLARQLSVSRSTVLAALASGRGPRLSRC
ncbi:MAG: GntR family transcriptional regulator [Actinomycetota bacterium]|nr:GntR family transcriptional regulator [Actinomycetota bacterium]